MNSLSAFLLAALCLLGTQEPDEGALIIALGSEDPKIRDAAASALEKRGSLSLPALQKAAENKDAEIAHRARDVHYRIRLRLWSQARVERTDSIFPFGWADRFCVSADGRIAVGCDPTQHIKVWSVPEGRLLRRWTAAGAGILRVELQPQGKLLVSCNSDDVSVWELPSGKLLRQFLSRTHQPRVVKVSPDGSCLAVLSSPVLRWMEAATGRPLWSHRLESHSGIDVALSPDGRRVAVVSMNTREIPVLDTATGLVVAVHEVESTGTQSTIDYSQDGTSIVVTNRGHGVAWKIDADSGKVQQTGILEDRYALQGRKPRVHVTGKDYPKHADGTLVQVDVGVDSPDRDALSPDDRFVAALTLNGKQVQLFDATTGKKLRDLGADLMSFAAGSAGVLGGSRTGDLTLVDYDGRELRRVTAGNKALEFVSFAGADRALTRDVDSVIRCLQLSTGKLLWKEENFRFWLGPYRFHPNGKDLIGPRVGENSLVDVVRFDLQTGEVLQKYGSFKGYVAGIGVSPDGGIVAASGRDGPLIAWETEGGKNLWELKPGVNDRLLLFTPDSGALIAGDEEGNLARFESRTGKRGVEYPGTQGLALMEGAISADGRRLAVLTRNGPRVYDLADGTLQRAVAGTGQNGAAFLDGGNSLIYGMPGAQVQVESGEPLRQFSLQSLKRAHPDSSRTRLGVLMTDGRFRLLDLPEGKLLKEIRAPEGAIDFILGPEGVPVYFTGEYGQYLGSLPEPLEGVGALRLHLVGSDVEKRRLYVRTGTGLEIRDLVTLKLEREVPLKGVRRIQAMPGSSSAYAVLEAGVLRLNRETLEPLRDGDLAIPPGDLDEMNGFLLSGLMLRRIDFDQGVLLSAEPFPSLIRSFFGPRGETVITVDREGILTVLRPAP